MKIENCILLDFNKEEQVTVPSIHCDVNSRFVKLNLRQNKKTMNLEGVRVCIMAVKPDGREIFNDCTVIDAENGIVEFEITKQMGILTGTVECQIKLFGKDMLLSSNIFNLSVTKTLNLASEASKDQLETLVNVLGEVQDINNRFTKVNQKVDSLKEHSEVEFNLLNERVHQVELMESNGEYYYYPNSIYNSNFERFNELGIPDFWETTGIVSTLQHLTGTHSLRLTANQYLKMKDQPILTYKWLDFSTLFSFYVIGSGKFKVQVLSDDDPLKIYSYINNEYQSGTSFTFTVNRELWLNSKIKIELPKTNQVVHLKIECLEGTLYFDGMSAIPILTGSNIDIPYSDGPMCYNDVMSYREDDLINANVGDMWFKKG